jgi:hypothetical protein
LQTSGANSGEIGLTYRRAQKSRQEANNPAELNKLLVSMNVMYRQMVEGGYRPQVDITEKVRGITDPKQLEKIQKEATREQILKDFDAIGDKYAEKKIQSYVDAKAKYEVGEEDLRAVINQNSFSRADIRNAVYQLSVARMRLMQEIQEGWFRDSDLTGIKNTLQDSPKNNGTKKKIF